MEELQGAADLIQQMALRREVLSLCSLVPFPMHGLAQQRAIQDFAGIIVLWAPVGTHSWDEVGRSWESSFLATLAVRSAQLHCVGAP